jgi:hypothetical protein
MTATFRLPPTDRDFEIYQAVQIDGQTTRAAAETHNLSQTRIRQVVCRVIEWIAETLPAETDLGQAKAVQLARHIAADRFQSYLEQAMDLWRKEASPKHMGTLLRITFAQVRLGLVSGQIGGLIADAIEGEEVQGPTSKVQSRTLDLGPETLDDSPPPSGDCSIQSNSPSHSSHLVALPTEDQPTTTSSSPTTCASPAASSKTETSPLAPTHRPLLTHTPSLAVTQLRVAPDAPAEVTLEAIGRRRLEKKRRTLQGAAQ